MEERPSKQAHWILTINTLAFTLCFAAWMLNGVLVTFLVENQVYDWSPSDIGWLMGIPVLTGAVFRLPAGILTDKFGGKPVMFTLLLLCSLPLFLLYWADSYLVYALCSFGFGLAGASFAVGVAYTSLWYPKKWQGRALGIFGAGNAGAALTTMFGPTLLESLTNGGEEVSDWRYMPVIYGCVLVGMAFFFLFSTRNKKPESSNRGIGDQLASLKRVRVWRFGLYYFLVFGCFVAFSQWLITYYVNVYYLPLVTAGLLASFFSLPAGVIRILGGWLSDRFGARRVMYWVLGLSLTISILLVFPKMEVSSPGQGIMAKTNGTVEKVERGRIVVDGREYEYKVKKGKEFDELEEGVLIFPTKREWQKPVVEEGEKVKKKQLLAKGTTKIYFQANVWVFSVLVILIGTSWGIGTAAVYKHIPNYYPDEVGVVGGMVGVLGGLGGFVCPILFGYLLEGSGLWTSCWIFIAFLSALCLFWMHRVVQGMIKKGDAHPAGAR